ncbi:MAG TPA: endonuclease/exonuclease/phosphatase family protein [Mycobacteriales bacterium]|jgi:endonuclease/exonuclease/phosphatase family metal-dependent hydrolase|nr:endonuclease/exonuclease/phosphatase family protein [Mycobacteriales bacterium]
MTAVRVLSYNVMSLRMSRAAVVDVIRAAEADVLCLQEAPRFLLPQRTLARLAHAVGMVAVAGHARAGAVHVLVRPGTAVVSAGALRLARDPAHHRRGVAHALLEIAGVQVAVASLHMSLYADERARHLPGVLSVVEQYGAPAVIAGDLNEQPDGAVWRELAGRYQDAYAVAPDGGGHTFSAQQPSRRIDAVFVDRAFRVVRAGVPDLGRAAEASDHCPLVAVIDTAP